MEQTLDRAQARGYDALLARHTADYQTLYGRAALHLDGSETFDALPTNQRLQQAKEGQADLGLNQLLFDFGRYLLISCSRPGGLPANLQGIWNQEFQPPWESKYTININAQMNYWPAESCNLSECHLPLFSLLEQMVESGRRMARGMYGCRGIVAHHNTDIHGDCAPQDTWLGSSYWVMGAAWLCTHVWTHYEYTQDAAFLRRFYPVLCETALFFLDFLVEKDGYLVTCPSLSPENEYRLPNGEQGAVTYGATMDNQILRDLFSQCLAAAEILDRGAEDPARAAELAGRGIPSETAFLTQVQQAFRQAMRKKVYEEQGLALKQETGPAARNQVEHSIICGSPDTVSEEIARIDSIGVGGLLMVFRMGPMPFDVAESSIRLFMKKVAPQFRRPGNPVAQA